MSRSVYASSTFTRDYTVNVYNTKAGSLSSLERPIVAVRLPARVIKNTPQERDVGLYIGKYNILSFTLEISNASTRERKRDGMIWRAVDRRIPITSNIWVTH